MARSPRVTRMTPVTRPFWHERGTTGRRALGKEGRGLRKTPPHPLLSRQRPNQAHTGITRLGSDPESAHHRYNALVTTTAPLTVGHAFISYVHEDSEQVDALCEVLDAAGITVWRDRDQLWPGDDWKAQIRRAIRRNALAFVACFSRHSIARGKSYQNEELFLAVEEYRLRPPGRPWLFPVRFDDIEIPNFDLGAGKTLEDLQRTDLFGAKREPELTRLAIRISQVIGARSASVRSPEEERPVGLHTNVSLGSMIAENIRQAASSSRIDSLADSGSVTSRIKMLLRDPAKDIELDDYVTELADTARLKLMDEATFPTSSDAMQSAVPAARFVIERVDQYWEIVRPLARILAVGCAWGTVDHETIWSRAMRTLANTTPMEGGLQTVLDLRAYPRIMAVYAAGLGAIARNKYSALRAVAVDAKYRDRQMGQTLPVIAVCHPAFPFQNVAPFVASALAIHTINGRISDREIENLSTGQGQISFTPISDDLYSRLRDELRPVIRDDEEYSDIFDKAEVLFGLMAQDASLQYNGYLPGGWIGRYVWSGPNPNNTFRQICGEVQLQGSSWPPLEAGLFDHSIDRVTAAINTLSGPIQYP